jgi:hypothetical protein
MPGVRKSPALAGLEPGGEGWGGGGSPSAGLAPGGGGTGSRQRLRPGVGDGAERGGGWRLWRWGTALEASDGDEEERRRELTWRPGDDGARLRNVAS